MTTFHLNICFISSHFIHVITKHTQGYITRPYLIFPHLLWKDDSCLDFRWLCYFILHMLFFFKLLTVVGWRLITRNIWLYLGNKSKNSAWMNSFVSIELVTDYISLFWSMNYIILLSSIHKTFKAERKMQTFFCSHSESFFGTASVAVKLTIKKTGVCSNSINIICDHSTFDVF